MRVRTATSGGHPGRPNEDFVGHGPGEVVAVVDGAGIPGTESLCRHGTAWHAHTLGARLLEVLASGPGLPLVDALADAIDTVAGLHRHTCDLTHPSSPQSTVAVARFARGRVDHLVLGDVHVVLDHRDGPPTALTDPRELAVHRKCTAPLAGLSPGSAAYQAALPEVKAALRARRNRPGGYWIAKEDPAVAQQAVTGSHDVAGLRGVALLSNGVRRLVTPYRLCDWATLLTVTRDEGPARVLRRLRDAEDQRGARLPGFDGTDDATVAYADLEDSSAPA